MNKCTIIRCHELVLFGVVISLTTLLSAGECHSGAVFQPFFLGSRSLVVRGLGVFITGRVYPSVNNRIREQVYSIGICLSANSGTRGCYPRTHRPNHPVSNSPQ